MGFADMLIGLGIQYNSHKALETADELMKFIHDEAVAASVALAEKRGVFPNFKKSILADHYKMIRNASLLTIAPTGTLSIIAGCSSGIEPLFAVNFVRNVMEGTKMMEINPYSKTDTAELRRPITIINLICRLSINGC